jgi:hypothetical protein
MNSAMGSIRKGNCINGKVGDLVYYELNGKEVVRTLGKVSKSRYQNDKSFAKMRANMSEFGAASMIGKVLRNGLSPFVKKCGDPYVSGRLNGVLRKIISLGTGESGQRSFEMARHGYFLEGFELNRQTPFGSIFFAPFVKPIRVENSIEWKIPAFNARDFVRAPKAATHFKVLLGIVFLSAYHFDEMVNSYVPLNKSVNGRNLMSSSPLISIGGEVGDAIAFRVDVGLLNVLTKDVGVVVSAGIVFYQHVNGAFYELSDSVAMKIVAAV